MAKKSTPADPDFFQKKRKCVSIGVVTLLKNMSGDRRIKITVSMNLTEDGDGKPEFVAAMFNAVAKDQSSITLLKSSIELEGTAIAFFSTAKIKGSTVKAASCTLRSFQMTTKKTHGKDLADVMLTFSIYAPASEALWDWGYQLQGEETFAEFSPTQMSFGDAESSEADEAAE